MPEPRELILLTKAQRALAQAGTIDEVKQLRDKATAVKAYVQKAQLGQQLLIDAAVFRLRAERRLGEMLATMELAHAAPGNQYTDDRDFSGDSDQRVLLDDLGITKADSARSQTIAGLSDDSFERYIADQAAAQRQPTLAGLLRLARQEKPRSPADQPDSSPVVAGGSLLADILAGDLRFATVYAAPPWPRASSEQQSLAFSLEDLLAEPVLQLCKDNAHLHVWSDIGSLSQSLQLIHAWGFRYRSCLVCLKPKSEGGEYWQQANRFLLLGIRGRLPFNDLDQPSWIELDWPKDGGRPNAIHTMIETVSPPPYLQLLADERPPSTSWTVCPSAAQR